MAYALRTLLCVFCVLSCAPEVPHISVESRDSSFAPYSSDAVEYFAELGFGSEFEKDPSPVVRKWTSPIRIQLSGSYTEEDRREVLHITGELSELTGLSFSLVHQNPNVRIYFTAQNQFSRLVPEYNPSNPQDGFFEVNSDIYQSNVVSATVLIRASLTGRHRKHILREELTQSMGLMKDSFKYKDSVFQENHEYQPVQYSLMDREVLKILYDKRIHPGMNKTQALAALRAKPPLPPSDDSMLASLTGRQGGP